MTAVATRSPKKKWKDLSPAQKKFVIIGAIVQIGLLAAAQIDLSKRPPEGVRGPKALWRILVLINFVGPLAYFAFGRRR